MNRSKPWLPYWVILVQAELEKIRKEQNHYDDRNG
jgi:hypothetical protein